MRFEGRKCRTCGKEMVAMDYRGFQQACLNPPCVKMMIKMLKEAMEE